MGMYTALLLNVELKTRTPRLVTDTLFHMLGEQPPAATTPDHPLFHDTRWRHMLRCDSAYFPARTYSTLFREYDVWFLNVQSNLKNYDNEISKFVDWISPYVRAEPGEFLGYWLYEEDETPTLIRKAGA